MDGCGVFPSLVFSKHKKQSPLRGVSVWFPLVAATTNGHRGKARYPHGPSAWLASPPSGGRERIDEVLDFEGSFRPEKPSKEIPFPGFRTRARVKQLWSSVIASIPTQHLTIKILKDFRVEGFNPALRDDGGGEADPDILEELAAASTHDMRQDSGCCRSISHSAQIRCAGLKGMLLGSVRLKGTRIVEVPENMLKFGKPDFSKEQLLDVSNGPPCSVFQYFSFPHYL